MASPVYHHYENSQPGSHGSYHYAPTNQHPYDDEDAAVSHRASPTFTPSPEESIVYEIRQGPDEIRHETEAALAHNRDSWTNKGPGYASLAVGPQDTENLWNHDSNNHNHNHNHNGDEDNAQKPPKRHRPWGRQCGLWMWEILACLLSLCALAAVIGVLVYEDGKPLDQWAWVIGPTAVVSFISTVAKSSMLLAVAEIVGQLKWQHFHGRTRALADLQVFDDAGRGPWGAAKFVVKKNVGSLLASLASILVIVGLLVDPFMQLVFDFPALSREDPSGIALFNRTEIYDPNGYFLDAHATSSSASAVDARMQSAIIRAVSDPSISPSVSCSTGNCTWSGITTLGICGSCSNITEQISISCPGPTQANNGRYQCDYLMPSGRNISGFLFSAGATGDFFPTLWNSSATVLAPGSSADATGRNGSLIHAEAVQLSTSAYDPASETMSTLLRRPVAWQCDFALCAKTYAGVSTTSGQVTLPGAPSEAALTNTGDTTNRSVSAGGGLLALAFYRGLRADASAADYRINAADYANLAAYLAQLFSSGWGASGFGASNGIAGATTPNLGWELAGAGDLDATARAVAGSMTEVMRNSRNGTGEAGVALRTRTYIAVRWGWVALPAALTTISLLLALYMLVATRGADLPVWKNSSLAVLAHRVEVEEWPPVGKRSEKGGVAARDTAAALERGARGVPVRLVRNSGEMAFVRG